MTSIKEYNIVLCGVGGQGTILASKILAKTAIRKGINCRVGETHGMSQRGGSVVSHFRMGDEVHGAITPLVHGQVMLAFEPVESLRYVSFMKANGTIVLNTHPIVPTSVNAGLASYPNVDNIKTTLENYPLRVIGFDATEIASDLGSVIALNMVILGASARLEGFPFQADEMIKSIEELVKPQFLDLNVKAFNAGYEKAASY
jgi:indolepyruvate ferredoxin oxidoreductase, beta subunit